MLIGTGIGNFSSVASAAVDPSDQRCFELDGDQGDAPLVNLTPVRAAGRGNGQLISSDVKGAPPVASNVNFGPGTVDPNVAVAPLGGDSEVCFQNSAQTTVDLIADHLGTIDGSAYTPATSTGAPDRRVDTRFSEGGARLGPADQLCFTVSGSPGDAAIVNLTPVRADGRGNGQLISSDIKATPPTASNVNFGRDTADPNLAIASIGADGQVCFQNSNQSSVDLIADHLGTLTGAAYTSATTTGAPDRKVDTRVGLGGTRIPASGQSCFSVNGNPGDAAIVNLTPVRAADRGNGQLISSDIRTTPPVASNVNFRPGLVDPNVAVTPIGADGQVCFQNSNQSAVDLVADHLGTIADSVYSPATSTGAPARIVDTRIDIENPRAECLDPISDRYSTPVARTMFGLSSRAYEIDAGAASGTRLDQISEDPVDFAQNMSCWVLITAFSDAGTDTDLIVARNTENNDLAVAFRGTESGLDVITDLDARRSSWTLPNGTVITDAVHRGFAEAYAPVRSRLVSILTSTQRADDPDARVYFTGHSLGGALATLASIDLVDELMEFGYDRNEVVTYTFGAPRSLSRTMAGHHATFAPQSYAVANPMDPIPQIPTAVGSNHYSHIKNMTMLHGNLIGAEVRIDQGDGRNHRGCLATQPSVAKFLLHHVRPRYTSLLARTSFAPAPSVSISIAPFGSVTAGRIQLRWDTELEGPCDEVALYRTAGSPTSSSTPIRDRDVVLDTNDVHSTTVVKGDDYWIGYVNMMGDIISMREYVPSTPSVSLRRNDNGFLPDTIDLRWSVSDPGSKDLVVLFDRDPRIAGPDGYYRSPVGRVESDPLNASSPGKKATFVGSNPNRWWVAYIMEDDDGNKRILSVSRGVSG